MANCLSPLAPYDGLPQKYYDMYARTGFVTTGWLPAAANASEGKEYLKDTVGSLRKCAAAVSALDDQVAALVAVLDKRGLRDGTLLIFASINGMLGGRHGLWGTGLGSDPVNMYADAVETPMIWNWPGRIPTEKARAPSWSARTTSSHRSWRWPASRRLRAATSADEATCRR